MKKFLSWVIRNSKCKRNKTRRDNFCMVNKSMKKLLPCWHNQRFPKMGSQSCLKNSWIIFCFYFSLSIQSITVSNLVFTPPVPLKWFCQNQQWPSCCQVHWLFFSFHLIQPISKIWRKNHLLDFSTIILMTLYSPHVFSCKFLDYTIRS